MNVLNRRGLAICVLALASQFLIVDEAPARDDADILAEYRLTDAGLEKFAKASRNLAAAAKDDPSLEEGLEGSDEGSIEEIAAMYDAEPAVRSAIESADMTSTEYVTFMYSMIQAGMGAWLVTQQGEDKLPAGTPRENVDYFRANEDKFEAMTKEMEQLSGEADEEGY